MYAIRSYYAEIGLLHTHFAGQNWNNETQRSFMELLREENFFNGEGANDPAFSARDRQANPIPVPGLPLLCEGAPRDAPPESAGANSRNNFV